VNAGLLRVPCKPVFSEWFEKHLAQCADAGVVDAGESPRSYVVTQGFHVRS
jgi:hypothetical protein